MARELGLDSALRLHQVRDCWDNVFKGPLSLHSYPSSLRGESLLVNVDSPVWLQEINFLRAEILKKLSALIDSMPTPEFL
jgi:predicted nucleic acid-binding Zn ribbon protein